MNATTYMDRVHGIRPKHRSYRAVDAISTTSPGHLARHESEPLFELEVVAVDEEPRIDLAAFLIKQGWPACAFTAHAVGLFAAAVKRRYIEARGYEPPRDGGPVYRGFTDWLIVRDTYAEEMGALVEQLVHEGRVS